MTVATSACSGGNDEPSKITLPKDQPGEVTYAANTSTGEIRFTAAASWSAHVSATSRTTDDIDWITLNDTHGPAGEACLNFILETNRSGKSRAAYIIILCEDQTKSFKITQGADDDPDEPDFTISGHITIYQSRYINGANGLEFDGDIIYELQYTAGRPTGMICHYRDDMDGYDDYCETTEETSFSYNETEGVAKADIHITYDYHPSGEKEYEDSEHSLSYIIGEDRYPLAQSGSYFWPQEGGAPSKFDFAYGSDGHLSQSRNDDGETGKWDTCKFTWTSGNLSAITSGHGTITYEYSNASLTNDIRGFDLNWALFNDFEVMDFAAGDVSKIWAVCGFLGKPSRNLATSVTETDRYGTKRSSRLTYKIHTAEKTEVRVEHFVDDQLSGYTDWEIRYSGFL